MKIKVKNIFVGLVATLCVGSLTYALIDGNTKEATPLDANYNDNVSVQNGLYVKVTDPSTIQTGEKLLLVGGGSGYDEGNIGI